MEAEVGYLEHPTAVDEAVAGAEVSVGNYFAIMKIDHSLCEKMV